jgi:uncharacterized membrane protein
VASAWQNRLRALMDLPPVEGGRPVLVALVALAVFALLLLVGRLFRAILLRLSAWLGRRLPGPVALIAALVLTAALFWQVGNGVIAGAALRALDGVSARLDALIEDGSPEPTDPFKTGGPGSLLTWEGLGRAGREVVAAPPDAARIAALAGGPALQPLRVYVGLNSADTVADRAQLARDEAIRIGAFERSYLVLATPTGTGWLDPESQQAMEYLLRRDVATISVQYSYLASWLALLTDPGYGIGTARAVFTRIYDHWHALPPETRPKLYLHGLSLGAFNSDLSHDMFQVTGDPYGGAFWAGPPFPSRTWGAVTFFGPGALWRRPGWMSPPVGPDVSPDLVWVPVVTLLQLGIDIAMATTTPIGYGHVYRFGHCLDGWAALTDAPGWTPEGLETLKAAYEAARP